MAEGTRMQQRRATEAVWTTSEYVLAAGELGVTTDTGTIKVGDGVNSWANLDPAFSSDYLPILGKAADSDLLDGIGSGGFLQTADSTTAATADKTARRTSDGRLKAATATENDDLTTLLQTTNAISSGVAGGVVTARQMPISRSLTDATTTFTLQLTDAGSMIMVINNSLTVQRLATIPTNASVAFPVGASVDICNTGAGNIKINPDSGVTVQGTVNMFGNASVVRLTKIATNEWLIVHLSNKNQTRLPRFRIVRTTTGTYGTDVFTFIPFNSLDTSGTFNPDNEWFETPGTGLTTARRTIIKKAGLYEIIVNFITAYDFDLGASFLSINKMTADNSHTGETLLASTAMFLTASLRATHRFAANESVGAAHSNPDNSADLADGTFGYRNDITITRLGD